MQQREHLGKEKSACLYERKANTESSESNGRALYDFILQALFPVQVHSQRNNTKHATVHVVLINAYVCTACLVWHIDLIADHA